MVNQNFQTQFKNAAMLPMQQGVEYMKRGDYQLAIQEFTTVIQIEKTSEAAGLAYLQRGQALASLDQIERAVDDWSQAILYAPKSPFITSAYIGRARFWNAIGQFGKAIADISNCIQLEPNNHVLLNMRGNYHHRMQDIQGALNDYTHSIQLNPRDYVTYLNRAEIYKGLGDVGRAMEDYNQAIVYGMNDGDTYFYRGELLYKLNKFDEALEDINKAIAVDANDPYYYSSRAEIRLALKEFDGAIEDYKRVIQIQPEALAQLKQRIAMAYNLRALGKKQAILRTVNDYTDYDELAIADLTEAIGLCPEEPVFYLNRGRQYQRMGLFDFAVADQKRYLQLGGGEKYGEEEVVKKTILLMEGCLDMGTPWTFHLQGDEKMFYQMKAVELVNTGNRLRKQGDVVQAIRKFTGALTLMKSAESYLARGYSFIALHKFVKAIIDFRQVLEISYFGADEKNKIFHSDAYYGIALACYRLDNIDEAEINLQEARKIVPGDEQFEQLWRDIQASKTHVPTAQIINSDASDMYLQMGFDKKRIGDYKGSINAYQQSIKLNHKNVMAYYGIGKVSYLIDKANKALRNYIAAVHLSLCNMIEGLQTEPEGPLAIQRLMLEQQMEEAVLQSLRKLHPFADLLLLDPNTPRHVGHVLVDLNHKFPKNAVLKRHISNYRRALGGDSSINVDFQIEETYYTAIGRMFVLNNLDWQKLRRSQPYMIYTKSRKWNYEGLMPLMKNYP